MTDNNSQNETIEQLTKKIQQLEKKLNEEKALTSRMIKKESYDLERYRKIAEKYYDQAAPVRKSMNKFLDQVEEQIHDLRQKNLLGDDLVGKFIKHLEWLILMFRKEI